MNNLRITLQRELIGLCNILSYRIGVVMAAFISREIRNFGTNNVALWANDSDDRSIVCKACTNHFISISTYAFPRLIAAGSPFRNNSPLYSLVDFVNSGKYLMVKSLCLIVYVDLFLKQNDVNDRLYPSIKNN